MAIGNQQRVLPHYAEQYLIRGIGLIRNIDDIGMPSSFSRPSRDSTPWNKVRR